MSKTFYGSVKLKGTLASGVGDNILTKDASSKEVGEINSDITYLTDSYIFVGNASNVPTGVVVTGDISISNTGVTAIASGVIVNADINASAAIGLSKLAALTASRALVSDGSGVITASSVTTTEVGYLSGVSSSIQTQFSGKQNTITGGASTITTSNLTANRALIANASGKVAVSSVTDTEIGYVSGVTSALQTQIDGKLSVTLSTPADGDVLYRNGGVWTNLPIGANGQVLTLDSGLPSWQNGTSNGIPSGGTAAQYLVKLSGTDYDVDWDDLTLDKITDVTATATEVNLLSGVTTTATQFNYLNTATSDIQTQLNNKLSSTLAQNAIFVGNSSNVAGALAAGSNGQVLTISGGAPVWATLSGTGTVTSVAISGGTTGLSVSGSPITTSGTITLSGTLVAANGGTGQSSYSTGDILYASGATALSKLSVGSDGDVLTLASGVPTWAAPSGGGTGTVTDVTGTADRITISGTATVSPVVDIASTYVGQASITTLGTVTTGTWSATTIAIAKGGTGLTSLGTANQLLRVNAGATALEYFSPTFISANQTITLSGDVSGSGTTAITATVGSNVVDDTKFRQSAGLSVVGRTTNSTGNVADITAGTDNQVLRRNGTSLAFGAVNLASSDAVTGVLAVGNGGTGSSSGAWLLSGTSTLAGVATVTSNTANQIIFNGTWTATANNQYHLRESASITARATNSDTLSYLSNTATLTAGANSQSLRLVDLQPTYALGATTSPFITGLYYNPSITGTTPTHYAALFASGRIGIGTLTPTAKVQIVGDGTSSGILFRLQNSTPTSIYTVSDDGTFAHTTLARTATSTAFTWTQGSFNPSSGTNSSNNAKFIGTYNTTGTYAGNAVNTEVSANFATNALGLNYSGLRVTGNEWAISSTTTDYNNIVIDPVYNSTGTHTGNIYALKYSPTETGIASGVNHYGIVINSTTAKSGFGTSTPTALVDTAGSSTVRSGFRMRSGTAPTSPQAGDFWFDGTNLKFYDGTTTRTITWT
jgi:hypothetical protein